MKAADVWLARLLRLNGVILLLGFPAMLLPYSWMNHWNGILGLGDLPDIPLMGYLTRSQPMLYGMTGVFTLIFASDINRYRVCVACWALCSVVTGGCLLAISWYEQMPGSWICFESPYLIPLGLTMLVLLRSGASEQPSQDDRS